MKIVYLVRTILPNQLAHSVQIFNSCAALASAGADVTLFALNQGLNCGATAEPGNWPLGPEAYFGVERNFRLVTPPAYRLRRLFGAKKKKLFLLGALRHAKAHLQPGDVTFTRIPDIALEMARSDIPVALEIHDEDVMNDPACKALINNQSTGPGASFLGVVSISRTLADRLEQNGVPAPSILIAHDGIDPDRFAAELTPAESRGRLLEKEFPALEFGPKNPDLAGLLVIDRPVIGYCGHFYPGRGIDMLVECAARKPEWTFLLIGGFEKDVEPYREMARKRSLANIIFTGYVPNLRLAPFLWACDMLTMPYEAAREKSHFMSPMKMFEYMACGRAIIAADWPQIREILSDGRNALLHAPGDVDALETAIGKAAGDKNLRTALAANAREDVEEYTWRMRGKRIATWLSERVALPGQS